MVLAWPMTKVSDLDKRRWSRMDMALLRRLLKEYLAVRPYVFGDYYPLMPYSLDQKVWTAWQFNRPDLGEDMLQAFRRAECVFGKRSVRFQGLDPDAVYTLTNLDVAGTRDMTGRVIMDNGLSITIKGQPGSAVIIYKKTRS